MVCLVCQVSEREAEDEHVEFLQQSQHDLEHAQDVKSSGDEMSDKETDEGSGTEWHDAPDEEGEMNADIEERFSTRYTQEGAFAYM